MTATNNEGRRFSRSGLRATQISVSFVLLTFILLITPAAGSMRYGFPALAFLCALLVYRQSKPFYAGFVVWLWMLAPMVRRIVEYRAGGTASLIIAAPFLACAVPLMLNLTSIRQLFTFRGYPVLFAGTGIAYGFGIGFAYRNHLPLIASELAFWIAPLLFAFFIVLFRSQIREIRVSLEKAFIWGTVVIGAYGLYQYLVLAPWDAFWVETTNLVSIGLPEPEQVRVFSTMNSPQGLAAYLVAGIFISVRSKSWIKWLAIPLASISLLLTQSRTSWVGFIAGFIYLIFRLPVRQKLQVAAATILSAILILGALQGDRKAVLFTRLQTLTAPNEDGSFSIRLIGYAALLPQVISKPFGAGLGIDQEASGSPLERNGEGLGPADSTVIALLFGLGIPGTLIYLTGIGTAVFAGFRRRFDYDANELTAFEAILVATLASTPAIDVFQGPIGFLCWTALAFYYVNKTQESTVMATSDSKTIGARSVIPVLARGQSPI